MISPAPSASVEGYVYREMKRALCQGSQVAKPAANAVAQCSLRLSRTMRLDAAVNLAMAEIRRLNAQRGRHLIDAELREFRDAVVEHQDVHRIAIGFRKFEQFFRPAATDDVAAGTQMARAQPVEISICDLAIGLFVEQDVLLSCLDLDEIVAGWQPALLGDDAVEVRAEQRIVFEHTSVGLPAKEEFRPDRAMALGASDLRRRKVIAVREMKAAGEFLRRQRPAVYSRYATEARHLGAH